MLDPRSAPESPKSKGPLILTVIGAVIGLIGLGRCGAFGSRVDDYGISGALFLVVSGVLFVIALIWFVRGRN